MRKRGESAAGWDDDPDAELRWAATDRLAEAVCQAVRNGLGRGPFSSKEEYRHLQEALDEFWHSAYEAALNRANEYTRRELYDHEHPYNSSHGESL